MNRVLSVVLVGLLVAACSGGGSDAPAPPQPALVGPTASFTVSASSGTGPLEVTFSDTSTPGSASITSRQWNFGDGTTSTAANPTHTYLGRGSYTVTLTVTTSVGTDDESVPAAVSVNLADSPSEPTQVASFTVDGVAVEAADNQVLVFFQEDATSAERDAAIAAAETAGAFFTAFSAGANYGQFLVPDTLNELAILSAVEGLDGVTAATLNEVLSFDRQTPFIQDNQTGFERFMESREAGEPFRRYGLGDVTRAVPAPSAVSFNGDYWIDAINAPAAWSELSETVLEANSIAFVDTGFPDTQDFIAESRVTRLDGDGDSLSGDDTFGPQTHGLYVGGFAAAYANGANDRRGVNPHSDVISVDVYRSRLFGLFTFFTDVAEGAVTAIDQGADVVNISMGDTSRCTADQATRLNSRQRWREGVGIAIANHARANDALAVFSAGNNCEKQDDQLFRTSDIANEDSFLSNVFIVGASNPAGRDACFSRMGDVVDIMAPGQDVGVGDGTTTSGTSFSAPIITGALGLVRSVNSTLSAPEAKRILLETANASGVTMSTTEQNLADCTNPASQVSEATWTATGPRDLIDLAAATQTALLTKGVSLTALTEISLAQGASQDVQVTVTVPDEGVNAIDLVFLIDQSGSYGDDIDTLQAQAASIVADLSGGEIDLRFAVAGFSDFPIFPYGDLSFDDFAYRLYQPMTDNQADVIAAIELLDQPLGFGQDIPESQYEALFQVATGAGRDINGDGDFTDTGEVAPSSVGFRDGALPIILIATDADFHDSDTNPAYPGAGRAETIAALKDRGVIVFGLQSGGIAAATARLEDLATETGGGVFALDFASSQIAQAIRDAIDDATQFLDIRLEPYGGDAWITSITPAVIEDVAAGDTATFTVTFTGQRRNSVNDLDYDVYLWALGNDTALLGRYNQPIRVARQ